MHRMLTDTVQEPAHVCTPNHMAYHDSSGSRKRLRHCQHSVNCQLGHAHPQNSAQPRRTTAHTNMMQNQTHGAHLHNTTGSTNSR
jgi:hypothetical protein